MNWLQRQNRRWWMRCDVEAHARATLAADHANASLTTQFAVDLRYLRQSSDLTIPVPELGKPATTHSLVDAFHQAHAATYGYARETERVEVVSVRVRLIWRPVISTSTSWLSATTRLIPMLNDAARRILAAPTASVSRV